MNTFGSKVKISGNEKDGTAEYHYPHEYNDTLKNVYLSEFLYSEEYDLLKKKHNRSSVSYSIFKQGALLCPCVGQPSYRVCVDEIETSFNEALVVLQDRRKKSKMEKVVCTCAFCVGEVEQKKLLGKGIYLVVFTSNLLLI